MSNTPEPAIDSVTPDPVAPGGSLTFTGSDLASSKTAVFQLGENPKTDVTVTSATGTTVVVAIPSTLAAGNYEVYLETSMGNGSNKVPISVS